MDKKKNKNKWTQENITYLKKAYLQGAPLKLIAAKLDSSVSAINKVLSRHNLRTHTKVDSIPLILPRFLPPQLHLAPKEEGNPTLQIDEKPTSSIRIDCKHWVTFNEVLQWLLQNRVIVQNTGKGLYYEVGGYPKNQQQVLLMANLLREERQLPIFFVKGITEG